MGYKLIIIPSDLQRVAIKAMQLALRTISAHGDSSSIADQLATFQEREEVIETKTFLKFEYLADQKNLRSDDTSKLKA